MGRLGLGWGGAPGSRSYTLAAGVAAAALFLVGCGESFLPQQTDVTTTGFKTYGDLETAYDHVEPGHTRESQLAKIGFDPSAPNVEVLSYLGVIERFMPRDSVKFDHLAAPVRSCIMAQDRCTAYVFRPSLVEAHRTGDTMLDVFGFDRTTVRNGWSAEVTLLVQDGRVSYKVISGKPHIEETVEKVHPLGPLQDVGDAVVPAAEHATP